MVLVWNRVTMTQYIVLVTNRPETKSDSFYLLRLEFDRFKLITTANFPRLDSFFFFFFSNWFIAYECLVSNMFRWMSVLCLISYLPVPAPKLCYHSTDVILVRPILFWHIVCIHVCKLGVCVFAGILCYFVEKCLLTKSIGNYLIDIIHVFAFASLSLPSVHLFAYKLEHRVCTLLFSHIFFLVFHWFIYFSEVFFSNSDFGSIHSIYREPTRFFFSHFDRFICVFAHFFALSLKNSVWFMGF